MTTTEHIPPRLCKLSATGVKLASEMQQQFSSTYSRIKIFTTLAQNSAVDLRRNDEARVESPLVASQW
jgi:hypothetical protein